MITTCCYDNDTWFWFYFGEESPQHSDLQPELFQNLWLLRQNNTNWSLTRREKRRGERIQNVARLTKSLALNCDHITVFYLPVPETNDTQSLFWIFEKGATTLTVRYPSELHCPPPGAMSTQVISVRVLMKNMLIYDTIYRSMHVSIILYCSWYAF
jgi:hypothetical protein